MGRIYQSNFENVAVSAAQDLFELQPASNKPVKLHEVHITADGTDSEVLRHTIKRLTSAVTSGSGGSTPDLEKQAESDAAGAATVEANNTTRASTSGATNILYPEQANLLNGFHRVYLPENRPTFVNGEALIVGLEEAPSAARNFSGSIIFEEIA